MAKLEKSFQDYFRIPILLRRAGITSHETIVSMTEALNQIEGLPSMMELFFCPQSELIKKNRPLYQELVQKLRERPAYETQKLYFIYEEFHNQWPQYEIIYKTKFVIVVYSSVSQQERATSTSQTTIKSANDLNPPFPQTPFPEQISKMKLKLKQDGKVILGVIFLNSDNEQYSKALLPDIKSTILPGNLPIQQLTAFIEPWLTDLIIKIQSLLIEMMLEYKEQDNTVIIFNRSEEKSEPKIMKRKKKYRCVKLFGDTALMLHLYQYAYQCFHEAEQQLKKVDDYLWVLGCIQGKLACMTGSVLQIEENNLEEKTQELIAQSFNFSKKAKNSNFETENFFKILKLLTDQPDKFDEMVQHFIQNLKGLPQQQRFIYYCYLGSLYEKSGMERKKNYFFYQCALITENQKQEISSLLLKNIRNSKSLKKWSTLHSKVILKIIQQEQYFNKFGQLHLELLEQCSGILDEKTINETLDYLNYGNYEPKLLKTDSIIEIKEFGMQQSPIKPKTNRLLGGESPMKKKSGIFMGWRKKQVWLFEQGEPILFRGTIINKMPFELHLRIQLQPQKSAQKAQKVLLVKNTQKTQNTPKAPAILLILPPYQPYKFERYVIFPFKQQNVVIKHVKASVWNFTFERKVQPQIAFQLYEKQPKFILKQGNQTLDENQSHQVKIQKSSLIKLPLTLMKANLQKCHRLRITCSVYYDIDVGFQENQYMLEEESNFEGIDFQADGNVEILQSSLGSSQLCKQVIAMANNKCEEKQKKYKLQLKLKAFRVAREHLKKIEINIDCIKNPQNKYQINRLFTLEFKTVNSVQGQIIEFSTPKLEEQLEAIIDKNSEEIDRFKKSWNLIEDTFLLKVKFSKEKVDLQPFRVQLDHSEYQMEEIILSDQICAQRWIKLKKIRADQNQIQQCLRKAKQITYLKNEGNEESKIEEYIVAQRDQDQAKGNVPVSETLKFQWMNIVNQNMVGTVSIKLPTHQLSLRPNVDVNLKLTPKQNQENTFCLEYQLRGSSVQPHRIQVNSISKNSNVLLKGKTKVLKIRKGMNGAVTFTNKILLKYVIEKGQQHLSQETRKQRKNSQTTKQAEQLKKQEVRVIFFFERIGIYKEIVSLR